MAAGALSSQSCLANSVGWGRQSVSVSLPVRAKGLEHFLPTEARELPQQIVLAAAAHASHRSALCRYSRILPRKHREHRSAERNHGWACRKILRLSSSAHGSSPSCGAQLELDDRSLPSPPASQRRPREPTACPAHITGALARRDWPRPIPRAQCVQVATRHAMVGRRRRWRRRRLLRCESLWSSGRTMA
jgi:hypothetical protein